MGNGNEPLPEDSSPSEGALRAWIAGRVAERLKIPASEVDCQAPLLSFGVDSVEAAGMISALEERLKRKIDPAVLWEQPTIEALARHLSRLPGEEA